MTLDLEAGVIAIAAAIASSFIWLALFLRMLFARDRRRFILLMPLTGLLASVGSLASAITLSIAVGLITTDVPLGAISLLASIGRGALAMGGIIALVTYRPDEGGQS